MAYNFLKRRNAVSVIVSYGLLVVIVIGLAVGVFVFLKYFLGTEGEIECKVETTLTIDDVDCDREYVHVTVTNRGLFNVSAFYLRMGNVDSEAPIQLNDGTEIIVPPLSPNKRFSYRYEIPSGIMTPEDTYTLEVQTGTTSGGNVFPCRGEVERTEIRCVAGSIGVCGDGSITDSEECDVDTEDKPFFTDLEDGINKCSQFNPGFISGDLQCDSVTCKIDTAECIPHPDKPVCGDGKITGKEVCDPGADLINSDDDVLGGKISCLTYGIANKFSGGTLGCLPYCQGYNTSQCYGERTCAEGHRTNRDGTCTAFLTKVNEDGDIHFEAVGGTSIRDDQDYRIQLAGVDPPASRGYIEWDINDIPQGSEVQRITFGFYGLVADKMNVEDLNIQPSTRPNEGPDNKELFDKALEGNNYYGSSRPFTADQVSNLVLKENAVVDFQTRLDAGEKWFAVGLILTEADAVVEIVSSEGANPTNANYNPSYVSPALTVTYIPGESVFTSPCPDEHTYDEENSICIAEISDINEDGNVLLLDSTGTNFDRKRTETEIVMDGGITDYPFHLGYVEWNLGALPESAIVKEARFGYEGTQEKQKGELILQLMLPNMISGVSETDIWSSQTGAKDYCGANQNFVLSGVNTCNPREDIEQMSTLVSDLQSQLSNNKNWFAVSMYSSGPWKDDDVRISSEEGSFPPRLIISYAFPEVCNNGLDDDADGFIDCTDSDCEGDVSCPKETICDNEADDDLDGTVDCEDSDCAEAPVCDEGGLDCGEHTRSASGLSCIAEITSINEDGWINAEPGGDANLYDGGVQIVVEKADLPARRGYVEWDVGEIPPNSEIKEVSFKFYGVVAGTSEINELSAVQPSWLSDGPMDNAHIFNAIASDKNYVASSGTTFNLNINDILLNGNAVNDLQSKLGSGEDWFAIGFKTNSNDASVKISSEEGAGPDGDPSYLVPPTLIVEYVPREPREVCGDGVCEEGENCPQDADSCSDNVCYEPSCNNGCGEVPVSEGETDETCFVSGSSCNGNGACNGDYLLGTADPSPPRGLLSDSIRTVCDEEYGSGVTTRVSTSPTMINDLSTASDRMGSLYDCRDLSIDEIPWTDVEFTSYAHCSGGSAGKGAYCWGSGQESNEVILLDAGNCNDNEALITEEYKTYRLTNDFQASSGACFIIVVDNIVIDGDGKMLSGRTTSTYAFQMNGRTNVTITNFKIKGFDTGIYLANTVDSSIINNEISFSNNGASSAGIRLSDSTNNRIIENNLSKNRDNGLYLGGTSLNNQLEDNLICGNAIESGSYDIWCDYNSGGVGTNLDLGGNLHGTLRTTCDFFLTSETGSCP